MGLVLVRIFCLCLSRWKIDGKVGSFTLDNASYNKTMINQIKRQLVRNGKGLSFSGDFFQIRCCCHIINLIVQAGLKLIDNVVDKIRAIGKHFRYSIPKKKKFYEIAQQTYHLNARKGIRGDCCVKWNSTYLMLDRALYFRPAIDHVVEKDVEIKILLLSCACVLDPCFKPKFVEYCYTILYEEVHAKEKMEEVRATLCDLLKEYSDIDGGGVGQCGEIGDETICDQRKKCGRESQLDLYLEEKNIDHNVKLYILLWWKNNGAPRYPQLGALARDILAIPISSVPSESTFSMGKKLINPWRASLASMTIESLACYEDWLRAKGFSLGRSTLFNAKEDEDEDEDDDED
ncbi:putative AC9 transposase, partial [Bienertia sinuspersici]